MSCLFCDIGAGKIPCTRVYGDDTFLAFRDIAPKAPTHILVIPKAHIPGLNDLDAAATALAGELLAVGARIAKSEGIAEGGYRFVINCGQDGGQTVPHLHLHILGGRPLAWPPG